eukprot:2443798-Amphidinium_carterae.1
MVRQIISANIRDDELRCMSAIHSLAINKNASGDVRPRAVPARWRKLAATMMIAQLAEASPSNLYIPFARHLFCGLAFKGSNWLYPDWPPTRSRITSTRATARRSFISHGLCCSQPSADLNWNSE